ncbi:MAG: F0F1 ATP synthase subunit A, partial [Caldilineales bacterium]|nr:F0F1 ATP synthase subunit A [Caldilineales bacterium]
MIVIALALLVVSVFVRVPLPTILLPAEKIPGLTLFGFPITNTLIATLLADATILVVTYFAVRKVKEVPEGVQNLVEWIVEAFDGMLTDIAGKEKARQWLPLFLTILFFLLVANWWELVPGFDSIGYLEPLEVAYVHSNGTVSNGYEKGTFLGLPSLVSKPVKLTDEQKKEAMAAYKKAKAEGHEYHPHEEEASGGYVLLPFLRAAATDLNLPLALALISVTLAQVTGMRYLGLKYWRRFLNPVITGMKPIDIFVGLLEFVSEIAKIVSFSFRLFGNIFAGQVLLFVMPFLIAFLVPLPFYGLELFVGFMQAFVFAILTFIFLEQATHSHAG